MGVQTGQHIAGSPASESPSTATPVLLTDRYAAQRNRGIDRWIAWGVTTLLLVAGCAFLVFSGWNRHSDVEHRVLDYRVLDERSVVVDAQVTAPSTDSVNCAVEALSESYAPVGWKVIVLPAVSEHTRRFTTTVVTTAPATTGTVRECWVSSPTKPLE